MIKSYKIRIYPNKSQEKIIWEHIHSCRFIWNWMLSKQEELHSSGEKHLSGYAMAGQITAQKRDGEHNWQNNVSVSSCQTVCLDLAKSYDLFFRKKSRLPKFKKRKDFDCSYPVRSDRLWFDNKGFVHVEKVGKVRYKTDLIIPIGNGNFFSNPRIKFRNGKWLLTVCVVCENQVNELTNESMGIDLGVKSTMVVAFADKKFVFHNINKSAKMKRLNGMIKHYHRVVSRKGRANKRNGYYDRTNNIVKYENKLRKTYAKIHDIRNNYIHQCTHKCISMLPYRIVMEDLNVNGMMKNHCLAEAIQEQCFYEILRQMQYKSEWNGIQFVKADRFFPSSRICSNCGCVNSKLTLKDRTFVCPDCGFTIDRDYQAALNLKMYGV